MPIFVVFSTLRPHQGYNVPLKATKQKGQTPKSDIPPNIAPKVVTSENYLQIWDSSATLIGQLAIVTLFGAILGGIPLFGVCPIKNILLPRR